MLRRVSLLLVERPGRGHGGSARAPERAGPRDRSNPGAWEGQPNQRCGSGARFR
ncbi:hypothetical protein B005_1734 [Nocardiopsis alba ATCC BAA-2165]|uniref:Uncharacterized protein n=1 Tax=Nocardiopsis alba (strain ATCC BAA-2165 / BE74) TaxID=1205910 RepID=J7LG72_NOCAA|nr:hypothetical protein B005_1734 [Nocardiopsis alba ATCC BAA-2165]